MLWASTQIDKEVWFVGQGIKNISAKESFVAALQDRSGRISPSVSDSSVLEWEAFRSGSAVEN